MRTPTDALRSLARYTALALGPEWETRMSGEKGTFARPYARIVQVPSIQFVTVRLPQVKVIASYQIVAYPERGVEADASQLEAMRVVDLLWAAFSGPGVDRGRTERVPLYDYAGVPLSGPTAFADETRRDPRDFLTVESPPQVAQYEDPSDALLWSVAANIRMSWSRSAAVPSDASTTASVIPGAQVNG